MTGRHRAPSTTARAAARVAAVGAVAATPFMTVSTASAEGGMPPQVRDAVMSCESGDQNVENETDASSSASGYFQFVDGTWRLYGGREFAPRAIEATRAEQAVVADRAYAANGLRDWEASRACWQPKMGRHVAEVKTGQRTSSQEVPRHAVDTHHAHRHVHRTIGAIHVVQRGDTLSGIAAAHELSLRTIIAANREIIDDPDVIVPGQRIRI